MSLSAKDVDHYGVLGVQRSATTKEILKSYRKQALKYHPDKNKDPSAVKLFHQLSSSLELLTDAAARAAYDKILDGRAAAAARIQKMDGERKKFKEDLEAREKAGLANASSAAASRTNDVLSYELLQREMNRLREEGSEILRAEQERFRRVLREEAEAKKGAAPVHVEANAGCKLRLKWAAKKSDAANGGYSVGLLNELLSKYGEVAVVVSSQKKGSAMAEYNTYPAAFTAMHSESGLAENPLTITMISPPPPPTAEATSTAAAAASPVQSSTGAGLKRSYEEVKDASPALDHADFERIVLMKLAEAEQRKRDSQAAAEQS